MAGGGAHRRPPGISRRVSTTLLPSPGGSSLLRSGAAQCSQEGAHLMLDVQEGDIHTELQCDSRPLPDSEAPALRAGQSVTELSGLAGFRPRGRCSSC